jgi:hypothetical protein
MTRSDLVAKLAIEKNISITVAEKIIYGDLQKHD